LVALAISFLLLLKMYTRSISSLVERFFDMEEADGSIPSSITINAVIAQLVEQLISNHQVGSSTLSYSTISGETL
jgi:Na+-transporting methylmalonyl-CoA/oxaloacetate decarboxylase gamma subunit